MTSLRPQLNDKNSMVKITKRGYNLLRKFTSYLNVDIIRIFLFGGKNEISQGYIRSGCFTIFIWFY